jgi:hypothetical protein
LLSLPKRLETDVWIPVWTLPTHRQTALRDSGNFLFSGKRSITTVNLDPNKWFIAYVRFVTDTTKTVPLEFPKYKAKYWGNPKISLLEAVK